MAFNKAPTQSTYQTKDVKLLFNLDNRDGVFTKDQMAVNGFFDLINERQIQEKDYSFSSRDGLTTLATISTNIRGMYYWRDQNKLYVAYDDKIAILTATTGALVTTLTPFLTTSGDVGFTEFYYDTGSTKLVVSDGSRLITIDSANTVVTGADADMPTPHNPHILFLDGYLFMIKSGTADIYNSNLNDPLAYTSGDFITAEMTADTLVRIAKLNNYILALGSNSVEYFFDAANASGSPLQRNDTFVKNVGFVGGFARHENQIYFIGYSATTGYDLYLAEDAKLNAVKNPFIRRYMQPNANFYAAIVTMGGHDFYSITGTSPSDTVSFLYDLDTKLWTRTTFQSEADLPIQYAFNATITGIGETSILSVNGKDKIYYFNPNVLIDDGVGFTSIVQTDPMDFGSINQKFMSRLVAIADRPTSSSLLSVSYSDDDYQTFSTARTIELNQEYPVLTQLGRFRRRAIKLTYSGTNRIRLHRLEVSYNIGAR
jgi:hypothetical protein